MISFKPRVLSEEEIKQIPVMTNELLDRSWVTVFLLVGSVLICAAVTSSLAYMLDHLGALIRGFGLLSWVAAVVIGVVASSLGFYLLILPTLLSFAIMKHADTQSGLAEFCKDVLPVLSIDMLIAIIRRITPMWFFTLTSFFSYAAAATIMNPATLAATPDALVLRMCNSVSNVIVYTLAAVVIYRGTFALILSQYYGCPMEIATSIGIKAARSNPDLLMNKAMMYQFGCLGITFVGAIIANAGFGPLGLVVCVALHGWALYLAVRVFAQLPIAFREVFFGSGNTKPKQKQTLRSFVPAT